MFHSSLSRIFIALLFVLFLVPSATVAQKKTASESPSSARRKAELRGLPRPSWRRGWSQSEDLQHQSIVPGLPRAIPRPVR